MAVIKKKWNRFVGDLGAYSLLADFNGYITGLDDLRRTKLNVNDPEGIEDLFDYVMEHFIKYNPVTNSNYWKDMDIFLSSFKQYDTRFINLIRLKLQEYVGFYKKVLTDNGVTRALLYSKSYQNLANSSSETSRESSQDNTETTSSSASGSRNELGRKIHSETPQNSSLYNATESTADTLFDTAIADYASNLDRNKVSSSSSDSESGSSRLQGSQEDSATGSTETSNEGSSSTSVTGTTWEEGQKNLELVFYNELKEYIARIPEMIYNHYSIDTKPFTELQKDFYDYIKSLESVE